MTNRERKNASITCPVKKSLNFELTKLKHQIQANCLDTSKTNLYIFTKENCVSA